MAGIDFLNVVFFLDICCPIFPSKYSKSIDVILKQFLTPASSQYSRFKICYQYHQLQGH